MDAAPMSGSSGTGGIRMAPTLAQRIARLEEDIRYDRLLISKQEAYRQLADLKNQQRRGVQ